MILLQIASVASGAPYASQDPNSRARLRIDETREHSLAGGQLHRWQFPVNKGEAVHIRLQQMGQDFVLGVEMDEDTPYLGSDRIQSSQGAERLVLVAESTGTAVIEVRTFQRTATEGHYVISLQTKHATAVDRFKASAYRMSSRAALAVARTGLEEPARAEKMLTMALDLWRRVRDRGEEATTLYWLARALVLQGEHRRAVDRFEEALSISRELGDELRVAAALHGRGAALTEMGKAEAAVTDLERAADLYRRLKDDRGLTNALIDMTWALEQSGDREQSVEIRWKAVDLCQTIGDQLCGGVNKGKFAMPGLRRALNERPRDTSLLRQLGEALSEMADWERAEAVFRRALKLDTARHGPDHPEVGTDLAHLAHLNLQMCRPLAAGPPSLRALEIEQAAASGEYRARLGIALINRGLVLIYMDRLDEAESLLYRGLAINESLLGDSRANVAASLSNLAQLLQRRNRPSEAEPLLRRALELHSATAGRNDAKVAVVLSGLAQVLAADGRLAEAEVLARRALEMTTATVDPDHPRLARRLRVLGSVLLEAGRFSEAEPLARRALSIDEASLGPTNLCVAFDLHLLTRLLWRSDRAAEAKQPMRRAVAIVRASLPPEHATRELYDRQWATVRRGREDKSSD